LFSKTDSNLFDTDRKITREEIMEVIIYNIKNTEEYKNYDIDYLPALCNHSDCDDVYILENDDINKSCLELFRELYAIFNCGIFNELIAIRKEIYSLPGDLGFDLDDIYPSFSDESIIRSYLTIEDIMITEYVDDLVYILGRLMYHSLVAIFNKELIEFA
jgi:hypothetical protein